MNSTGQNKIILKLISPAKQRRNDSNRIVTCGGSYNPFHKGHKELLQETVESVDAAEVIVYITSTHSLGKVPTGASHEQRLEMLKLEQERMPYLSIGTINDGYFKNWFHRLNEFHPGEKNKYYCAMGADLFPKVLHGNETKDYPKLFTIEWLIADRSGNSYEDFNIPKEARKYLNMMKRVELNPDVKEVSSSGLRKLLNDRDERVLEHITEDVFEFIKAKEIYF